MQHPSFIIMLIYTPVITSRISYIMKLMIGELLQTEFEITNDRAFYEQYDRAKIAYVRESEDVSAFSGLVFKGVELLFEKGIKKQTLLPVNWNSLQLFFPVKDNVLPFDPFAVSFYLVSRYEEYFQNIEKDVHGRFELTGSVAYINGFYRKPVVNSIANEVGRLIHMYFPDFELKKLPFTFVQSYDVDIAYQYKGKSAYRFVGSFFKSIIKGDFEKSKKLVQALFGAEVEDEFDTFRLHEELAHTCQIKPIHFILTAPFGKYDRNIDPSSQAFKDLIEQLSDFSEIGIHPSYYSSEKPGMIKKEKEKLEEICKFPITLSRQHFLRFTLPSTFNQLIDCGITDDFSMGWTRDVGFRASISAPYFFYDLLKETETSLRLHPLAVMDSALTVAGSDTNTQMQLFSSLLEEVKQVGGEFVLLQHNSYSALSPVFSF